MRYRNVFVVAAVALSMVAFAFAQEKRQDTVSLQGKPAPEFELQTLDGQTVKLSDLKGEVVVLDFWATWCGPCVAAMPHLQELASNTELKEQGLNVFAVNLKEDEEKVKNFLEQNSYSFTVPMDRQGEVAKSYKVQGIPTQVVIGRDGKIMKVFVGFGPESGKQLDQAVHSALKAKAPTASAN